MKFFQEATRLKAYGAVIATTAASMLLAAVKRQISYMSLPNETRLAGHTVHGDEASMTKIEKGETGLDIAKGEAIAAVYGFGLDFIYRGELADVPDRHRQQLMTELAIAQAR